MKDKFLTMSRANGKIYKDYPAAFELFLMKEHSNKKIVNQLSQEKPSRIIDEDYLPCDGCKRPKINCECSFLPKERNIAKLAEIFKQMGISRKEH